MNSLEKGYKNIIKNQALNRVEIVIVNNLLYSKDNFIYNRLKIKFKI